MGKPRPLARLVGERPGIGRARRRQVDQLQMRRRRANQPAACSAAAVEPLNAIATSSGKSWSSCSIRLCWARRMAWSRLPRRSRTRSRPTGRCRGGPGRASRSSYGRSLKLLADGASEQSPELVGGMRIIGPGGERGIAGQASEDEQPCIGSGDRRQTGFDAHQETPTGRACSRAISASPSFRAITIMSATAPTRRSTGWSNISFARASMCASIRRRREPRLSRHRRSGRYPGDPYPRPLRISPAHLVAGAGEARPRRIQTQRPSHLQPRFRQPPRGELGPAQQGRGSRLGSHAVRDLPGLLPSSSGSSPRCATSFAGSTTGARW